MISAPKWPVDPLRSTRGTAAIEFAIVAPFLIVLIVSVIELGLAVRDSLRAQGAAAAGAYYAMQNEFDADAISMAVVNGTGAVGLSASPAPVLFCGCPTASGIASATCDTTCADGFLTREYVRVSASIARTTVLDAVLGLPPVLTRQSIARLP